MLLQQQQRNSISSIRIPLNVVPDVQSACFDSLVEFVHRLATFGSSGPCHCQSHSLSFAHTFTQLYTRTFSIIKVYHRTLILYHSPQWAVPGNKATFFYKNFSSKKIIIKLYSKISWIFSNF